MTKTYALILVEEKEIKVAEHGLRHALTGTKIVTFLRITPDSKIKKAIDKLLNTKG